MPSNRMFIPQSAVPGRDSGRGIRRVAPVLPMYPHPETKRRRDRDSGEGLSAVSQLSPDISV